MEVRGLAATKVAASLLRRTSSRLGAGGESPSRGASFNFPMAISSTTTQITAAPPANAPTASIPNVPDVPDDGRALSAS